MSKPICWVLQEDGTVQPVEGLGLMLFNTARVILSDGSVEVTDRNNLLDPDNLDKRFDCAAWIREMP